MIIQKNARTQVDSQASPQPQPTPISKNVGLRGVTVADSAICKIDGKEGVLLYRGYDIETLARKATYEEVAHLLIKNKLPNREELAAFKERIGEYSFLPEGIVDALKAIPNSTKAMDVLQGVVSLLAAYDQEAAETTKEANYNKATRLVAMFPLLVAAWYRIRQGKHVVNPNPELGIAGNFLYTMHGEIPDDFAARTMDVAMILHAEHSFNASTFTARQVASTRATMYAAIASANGSLSGELHGGANARVYEMLQNIGHKDNVEDFVLGTLNSGGRIMGMGHAVYKTLDPRAKILGPMSQNLGEQSGDATWYELSEEILSFTKEEFKRRKGVDINANVDFFSASVYHYMGIPVDLFTPIFAMARVSGWVAHYIEEFFAEVSGKPALYRPRADYIGRYCGEEGCVWKDVENRD
ncbi:MAG: citrate/2-methylcitrate synthase [Candidatus Lernaella stagnicola]|nr:citrate/2-methylcitrate synthase [Candidatus Lernaella stagnicola]